MSTSRAGIPIRILGAGALAVACAACSLSDPFDGYAEGERPPVEDAGHEGDAAPEAADDALSEAATQCKPGFATCETSGPGCETDLMTSTDYCGSCSTPCAPASAEPACVLGECTIKACTGAMLDCDGAASNGCEVDPASAVAHCGACQNPCSAAPNAEAVCAQGKCSFQCNPGHGDCDGDPSNGCETDTTAATEHCGSCTTACADPKNAIAVCKQGSCSFVCQASFDDCDKEASNGCETSIWTDVKNCSGCGVACSWAHATPECSNAHCSVSCNAGFGDCDASPGNGCEAELATDPLHCGTCALACPVPPGAVATCTQSQCGFKCQPGREDCNQSPADGCEVDPTTDPSHCGACGHSCVEGTCAGGLCSPILAAKVTGSADKAFAIAVDPSWIYFTVTPGGRVYRAATPGDGADAVLWDDPGSGGEAIAQDATRVYYATASGIRSKLKVGGTTTDIVTGYPGIKAIASDGTNLYWAADGGGATNGVIARVSVTGGTPVVLASNQARPGGIALASGVGYWTVQGTWNGSDYNNDGALVRAGGTVVAANQGAPTGVAGLENQVFWVNSLGGTLMKAATSGGSPQTILSQQSFSEDLVVPEHQTAFWVYYGTGDSDGTVMRGNLAALSSQPVAVGQPRPRRVAVDSTHVYWTVSGTGARVYRVVR